MGAKDTTRRPVTIPRSSAKARPLLRVIEGARRGEVFVVDAREFTIGRDPSANLQIDASGVSRLHAKLIRAYAGLLSVVDLNSTNGTYVNGVKVSMAAVREGDRIQLGPETVLALGSDEAVPKQSNLALITPRQREVARLVATGKTNREIAEVMGVSERTITSHLDHIYNRLGIGTRTALILEVVRAGELPG